MKQALKSTEVRQRAVVTSTRWHPERSPLRVPSPSPAAHAGEFGTMACRRRRLAPVTVDRLIRCRRVCAELQRHGREFVSSRELGRLLGCGASLIRKDLSGLGKLGTRGHGYRIAGLLHVLEGFLGGDGPVAAVLVGTGALGVALLTRGVFARDGLRVLAAFDFDPSTAGTRRDGLVVNHVSKMSDVLGALSVDVGVLAVAETEAQDAARLLAENGVRAILNLTPAILSPQTGVVVTSIDLATELTKLAFYAADPPGSPGRDSTAPGGRQDHAHAVDRQRGRDLTQSHSARARGMDVLAAAGGTGQ